ncbi:uncharacterized protein LOC144123781 [Amblyomma americanum]
MIRDEREVAAVKLIEALAGRDDGINGLRDLEGNRIERKSADTLQDVANTVSLGHGGIDTPAESNHLCERVSASNVFGGGHHHGFRGAGFWGPIFVAAATPGFSVAGSSYPPQPYSFGYDTTDEFETRLFHKEQGDASNANNGSYGYRDANGLLRTVSYVADANGFRAKADTHEPGTRPGASADAVLNANPSRRRPWVRVRVDTHPADTGGGTLRLHSRRHCRRVQSLWCLGGIGELLIMQSGHSVRVRNEGL